MTIRERVDVAKQKEYITVDECALLVGISTRTVWRRLPLMDRVIRDGRVVRVHRVSAMRYFLKWPAMQASVS